MFLANPRKLFSFAIYITLSCQILDIVITLVVDETHQSGKRLKSQRNSSQVHIKQVCAIWVFLFYERTAKSIQRQRSKLFCFTFDFDETFIDCSTHEYYNLTKFRQNRMSLVTLSWISTSLKSTFLFYIQFWWNFVRL